MPAYSTSKAGLIGFTNAVALDYGDKNIRVNIISPGATVVDPCGAAVSSLGKAWGEE
jgi:NAD(P)-dependent dehydrogenase (short-subunit alcohol dehydrogenase family)